MNQGFKKTCLKCKNKFWCFNKATFQCESCANAPWKCEVMGTFVPSKTGPIWTARQRHFPLPITVADYKALETRLAAVLADDVMYMCKVHYSKPVTVDGEPEWMV